MGSGPLDPTFVGQVRAPDVVEQGALLGEFLATEQAGNAGVLTRHIRTFPRRYYKSTGHSYQI